MSRALVSLMRGSEAAFSLFGSCMEGPMSDSMTTPLATPTPLEQAAAKGDDFSLADFRKAREEGPPKSLAASVAPAPAVAVSAASDRARDAQGRFVAGAGATPEAAPLASAITVPHEDDETEPPQNVAQFQKRLDKERWKRGEVERDAKTERETRERLEQELATLRPAPPLEPPPVPPGFPSYDEYLTDHEDATYDDYVDARVEFRTEQRISADRARAEANRRTHAAARAMHQIETLGAQAHADFEAVVQAAFDAGVRWAPHVTEFVLGHTETPEEAVTLTYALAKDHAFATRVSRLPPARAAYELGRLLAGTTPISATAASSGTAAPMPVTTAPAPFQPVGASATTSTPSLEQIVGTGGEMSLKRFRERRSR